MPTYEDTYVQETAHQIHERIKNQNGRNHKSQMLKHSIEKQLNKVIEENFKIIAKNIKNKKWK